MPHDKKTKRKKKKHWTQTPKGRKAQAFTQRLSRGRKERLGPGLQQPARCPVCGDVWQPGHDPETCG